MFEMAAFLHSKGPKAATCIQVCPVFVGPAFLAGHLGFSVLVFGFLWQSGATVVPCFRMFFLFQGGRAGALNIPCINGPTLLYLHRHRTKP